MNVIEEILKSNQQYADHFKLVGFPMPPGRELAVVACMDARLTIEDILGFAEKVRISTNVDDKMCKISLKLMHKCELFGQNVAKTAHF